MLFNVFCLEMVITHFWGLFYDVGFKSTWEVSWFPTVTWGTAPFHRNGNQLQRFFYEIKVTLYTFMSWFLKEQVINITVTNMFRKDTPISLFTDTD